MSTAIVEDQAIVRQLLRRKIPGCILGERDYCRIERFAIGGLVDSSFELPDGNALDWLVRQKSLPPVIILTSVTEDVLVLKVFKTVALG